MEELSSKQGIELLEKFHSSTSVNEIMEISQKLGMDFTRQEAIEYMERNLRIMALDDKKLCLDCEVFLCRRTDLPS